MPNIFAYIILFSWPIVASRIKSKLPTDRAVIYCILIPYLFLPVKTGVDLPVLPPLYKSSIIAFTGFFLFLFANPKASYLPKGFIPKLLCISLFLSPMITILANTDVLFIGGNRSITALSLGADLVSLVFSGFVGFYVPFMMGVLFLTTQNSHKEFLKAIVIIGLVYSVLMLFEIRMSPQLHTWIYGFFPHDFGQQMRQGGFRPVVFLGHGLLVAMFSVTVTVSAIYMYKNKIPFISKFSGWVCIYMVVVTFLCKTWSAVIYGIAFIPLVYFLSAKKQIKYCFVIAAIVFVFPFIRGGDLLPIDRAMTFFEDLSPDRAESLGFRFKNEDILLARANERPLFGWGGWGRSRVYNDNGEDISVTDGYWVIVYGAYGWFGYLGKFGLICFPLFALYRVSKKRQVKDTDLQATACLVILIAMSLIDFIPNSSKSQLTILLAGAVMGRAQALKSSLT